MFAYRKINQLMRKYFVVESNKGYKNCFEKDLLFVNVFIKMSSSSTYGHDDKIYI